MNVAMRVCIAWILGCFWFGVLTGSFSRRAWANSDPDTYIHAALLLLTALFIDSLRKP